MSLSIDEIQALLDVADRSLKWPQLKSLHDLALAQLGVMAKAADKELLDIRVAEADKAAKLEAARLKDIPPPEPLTEHEPELPIKQKGRRA